MAGSIGSARAERWPSLESYVSDCVLIVKAKTVFEGTDKTVTFRVEESWKGKYAPDLLQNTTKDGRFVVYKGEHGVNVVDGQEVVFFFTRHNNAATGPLGRHSTAFPVKDGKIVYASTSEDFRREYKIEEFRKAITELIEKQAAQQGGAGQPATRSESDSEGGDKPQPESEGRSR